MDATEHLCQDGLFQGRNEPRTAKLTSLEPYHHTTLLSSVTPKVGIEFFGFSLMVLFFRDVTPRHWVSGECSLTRRRFLENENITTKHLTL